MNAAVLAGGIAPTQADIRRDGVAELELAAQRAELRARVRRAVDGVGTLTRLPHDVQLRAVTGNTRRQVETALEHIPVEQTGNGPQLEPSVVVDVRGIE